MLSGLDTGVPASAYQNAVERAGGVIETKRSDFFQMIHSYIHVYEHFTLLLESDIYILRGKVFP